MSESKPFDGSGAECAAYLRKFNEWRRSDTEDNREIEMPHPREIGLAIDMAIELIKQRDELLNMLWKALPFVEDHEGGEEYKPETIKKTVEQIKQILKAAESHGQPAKQLETNVPAIVFFPAGSLGEEVDLNANVYRAPAGRLNFPNDCCRGFGTTFCSVAYDRNSWDS